ncbi:hypothetical protein E5288_WYG009643 [Bos mutus]|uniref:Immunoglobulin V-set domain-containing protein n=1 Tax=Bos mutus TaxID=72004 RepID=A0A6B0QYI3_9CETA|nr:hypothetical protein [Bos mutus]
MTHFIHTSQGSGIQSSDLQKIAILYEIQAKEYFSPFLLFRSLINSDFEATASGEAVLYQTPAYIAASLGESISITCRANQSISDYLSWYKQKPGQAPMILIYDADNRYNDTAKELRDWVIMTSPETPAIMMEWRLYIASFIY